MEKPPNSCHATKEEEKKAILSTVINTNHEPIKELESTTLLSKDKKLESTRDEIREIKDENQRLKLQLSQIMKDYEQLHTKFYNDVVQQERPGQSNANRFSSQATFEGHDVVCDLSLGRTLSTTFIKKDDIKQKSIIAYTKECNKDEGLTLGLECKYDRASKIINKRSPNLSPENSSEVMKEDEQSAGSKALSKKTMRSGEDEDLQQNPMKKARVCVRVRCDTPTINDGCQWRKYGQKIAKGNPCPRAYYRCTMASSCPVRKQVQRCVDDMSILITTYEGTHNHPLSMSATAMASTTSAALSMLMSGSKTSNHNQSYMPNSSLSTSTSSSHPTITLDLTSNPANKISPNFLPKYSSTNLNFSSFESNPMPPILNHGNNLLSHSSLSFGKQIIPQEAFYNSSFMQNSNPKKLFTPDNVAAATRAITSDPSFHSALATALSSIIGSRNGNGGIASSQLIGGVDNGNHDHVPTTMISNFKSNGSNNCSSSYSNIPPHPSSTNTHTFLQSSSSFSTSKSKSTSPSDNIRDRIS